ncbi:J domain-containing protein [Pseudonocardiaceae bacterium YIM PH 21723]|nr:J domain-containing protein [Pseudonocardiaceae bacterium YIM PH 21723]
MPEVDFYELLGVGRTASTSEIKSAYRTLSKIMHPDRGGTPGTFRLLQGAYETLTDPGKRAGYDEDLRRGFRKPEPAEEPVRRRSRPSRQDLGEDPNFTPATPKVSPAQLGWWFTVDPKLRVPSRPFDGPSTNLLGGVLVGWLLFLVVALLPLGLGPLLPIFWFVAGVGVVMLGHRRLMAQREQRAFEFEFAGEKVFGGLSEQSDKGEWITAGLLEDCFTRIPAVRVFHGLSWPGSIFTDTDHAVLCGNRLVLVESKMWLPGDYDLDESGELWRNGHPFRGGTTRLFDAVSRFRAALPELTVSGVVLIYPNRAGEVTVAQDAERGSVQIMEPEPFLDHVGRLLAREEQFVDRDAFRLIHSRVIGS